MTHPRLVGRGHGPSLDLARALGDDTRRHPAGTAEHGTDRRPDHPPDAPIAAPRPAAPMPLDNTACEHSSTCTSADSTTP
ncbi:hypothetical protein [Rhodococcoides kroppenstedtii]|uniref:hypothetical protein n=1 Tax=Rhodococcoides kroppenstedtii TaxID=293050 RepID=UPI001C9AADD1|nr:hypothetical protein [Rhodococcus kroppenstedtii]MBY6315315.1 hypothetical protein [Rhodococcus kroppenstedtii]